MSVRAVVLILSLAVNLLLGWAVKRNYTALPAGESSSSLAGFPTLSTVPLRPRANQLPATPPEGKHPFQWSQLETGDFPGYILRLRAFGVPDRIIRNMIIAEVNELYTPRFNDLRPSRTPVINRTNFWDYPAFAPDPDQGLAAWQLVRLSALEREKWTLIRILVGQDIRLRLFHDSSHPDLQGPRYSFLPEDKQDAVQRIDSSYNEARANILAGTNGQLDEDTQADLVRLALKEYHALAALLTPEELKEFEIRNSDTAIQIRQELGPLAPSEQEFRTIFAYRKARAAVAQQKNLSPEEARAVQGKLHAAADTLLQTLGTERHQQYQLLSNSDFHSLVRGGVPLNIIQQIADMKNNTDAAVRNIRTNPSLTPGQRAQSLQTLQANTQESLTRLLGERRAQVYCHEDGGWIQAITNQP